MKQRACANCEMVDFPAGDGGAVNGVLTVTIGSRAVDFCGLSCAIGFLEKLFTRWEEAQLGVRLN